MASGAGAARPGGAVVTGPGWARAVALAAILSWPAHHAAWAARPCRSVDARVTADDAADRADACAGARDAVAFFAALGLSPKEPLVITVTAQLPGTVPSTAAGCYQHGERRVYLLSRAALRRRGRLFDQPIDRSMYRSIAAHEVAHALTDACGAPWAEMSWHGREYVAYVAMFATMDLALRQRALDARPGTGFAHVVEITPLNLAFDPAFFAAEAYRHYLAPGNGPAFVLRVIRGEALTD